MAKKPPDSFYSDDEFAVVVAAFEPKPTFDCAKFRKSLELCAWMYVEGKEVLGKSARPAERKARTIGLRDKVADIIGDVSAYQEDPWLNRSLIDAIKVRDFGQSGARATTIEEFAVEAEAVLRAEQKVHMFVQWLAWFRDTLDVVESSEQTNRSSAALNEVILSIHELYTAAALHPRAPTDRGTSDQANEFLRLLQAALRPLGVERSDQALRKVFDRARLRSRGTQ